MVKEDLIIGKEVYFVSSGGWLKSGNYTVLNIGRKYATIYPSDFSPESKNRHLKISLEDFRVFATDKDYIGEIFSSKEEFVGINNIKLTWIDFVQRLNSKSLPKGMTLEKINQIKALINN